MKSLLLVLILGFSFAQAQAAFLVALSGTAYSRGYPFRLDTITLSAKRICKEFGVSPDDYVLVFDLNFYSSLSLRPKRTNSELPIIFVLQSFEMSPRAISSSNRFAFEAPMNSPSGPIAMFDGFRGTAFGRGHISEEGTVRGQFEVVGSSSEYILKFKLKLQKEFLPKP